MPHLSSNILSPFFYRYIFSGLFHITRCTLRINNFICRASDLFSKMMTRSENKATLNKQLKKPVHRN